MNVSKFGGAVLKDAEGFRRMERILQGEDRGLVVVSALATTTRDLEEAARSAQDGDLPRSLEIVQSLQDQHDRLVSDLIDHPTHSKRATDAIATVLNETRTVLRAVNVTRQLTPRTLDHVLAFGERLALDVSANVLQSNNHDVKLIDVRRLIVTTGAYGNAVPIESKTRVHIQRELRPLMDSYDFIITQGFVGATEAGETTTMGKESSNLSATFLGAMIDAEQVTIWTDVEGVRSTDPKLGVDTVARTEFTYEQARHVAHHGLKLMYPTMIEPVESLGIPIRMASALNPDGDKTVVSGQGAGNSAPIVTMHESENEGMLNVSAVFSPMKEWSTALAEAIQGVNDTSDCYVTSDPQDEVVTVRLLLNEAPSFAIRLHELLVLNKEQAHETAA